MLPAVAGHATLQCLTRSMPVLCVGQCMLPSNRHQDQLGLYCHHRSYPGVSGKGIVPTASITNRKQPTPDPNHNQQKGIRLHATTWRKRPLAMQHTVLPVRACVSTLSQKHPVEACTHLYRPLRASRQPAQTHTAAQSSKGK